MEHTKGELEIIARKDDSYDRPFYEYHLIAYPFGVESGPQGVGDVYNKADAHHLVLCWNEHDKLKAKADIHDKLLKACKTVNIGLNFSLSQDDSITLQDVLNEAITEAEELNT